MKTVFQITFPQEPGMDFAIENSNGHTMPIRARHDFRPGGVPRRPLTRLEWDDQRKPGGHYLRVSSRKAVPDVDFEAEDGSLHKTAEECLAHELKARFGVETLAEVEGLMKAISDAAKLTAGDVQDALSDVEYPPNALKKSIMFGSDLHDSNGNPPFSGVPESIQSGYGQLPQIAEMKEGYGTYGAQPSLQELYEKMEPGKTITITPTLGREIDADRLAEIDELGRIYPDAEITFTPRAAGARLTSESHSGCTIKKPAPKPAPKDFDQQVKDSAKGVFKSIAEKVDRAVEAGFVEDTAIRLLTAALSRRGLKHAEAAKATGLPSRACRELAKTRPDLFRDKAGKLYLVG